MFKKYLFADMNITRTNMTETEISMAKVRNTMIPMKIITGDIMMTIKGTGLKQYYISLLLNCYVLKTFKT